MLGDGVTFEGNVDSECRPCGRGMWDTREGTFVGHFMDMDGIIHGEGFFSYVDGSNYKGEWVDGLRHGRGTMWFPDGSTYEGDWADGLRHGKGTMTDARSRIYVGAWKNDKMTAPGTLFYPTGQGWDHFNIA